MVRNATLQEVATVIRGSYPPVIGTATFTSLLEALEDPFRVDDWLRQRAIEHDRPIIVRVESHGHRLEGVIWPRSWSEQRRQEWTRTHRRHLPKPEPGE